jgi:hypothetical protein
MFTKPLQAAQARDLDWLAAPYLKVSSKRSNLAGFAKQLANSDQKRVDSDLLVSETLESEGIPKTQVIYLQK